MSFKNAKNQKRYYLQLLFKIIQSNKYYSLYSFLYKCYENVYKSIWNKYDIL